MMIVMLGKYDSGPARLTICHFPLLATLLFPG